MYHYQLARFLQCQQLLANIIAMFNRTVVCLCFLFPCVFSGQVWVFQCWWLGKGSYWCQDDRGSWKGWYTQTRRYSDWTNLRKYRYTRLLWGRAMEFDMIMERNMTKQGGVLVVSLIHKCSKNVKLHLQFAIPRCSLLLFVSAPIITAMSSVLIHLTFVCVCVCVCVCVFCMVQISTG